MVLVALSGRFAAVQTSEKTTRTTGGKDIFVKIQNVSIRPFSRLGKGQHCLGFGILSFGISPFRVSLATYRATLPPRPSSNRTCRFLTSGFADVLIEKYARATSTQC
jgi:hypothetical protein